MKRYLNYAIILILIFAYLFLAVESQIIDANFYGFPILQVFQEDYQNAIELLSTKLPITVKSLENILLFVIVIYIVLWAFKSFENEKEYEG